eukprot:12172827-Heterocapsa_arctica.AAC.1
MASSATTCDPAFSQTEQARPRIGDNHPAALLWGEDLRCSATQPPHGSDTGADQSSIVPFNASLLEYGCKTLQGTVTS